MDFDPGFWEDKVINLIFKFEKMLKSNKEEYFDIDDFIDIIDIYLDMNKIEAAEKAVDIAIKYHPLSVDIITLKAEVYLKKNELNKAFKVLKFAQTLNEDSIDLILTWGFYYHKCRQNQKAKMFFERAIAKSNGDDLKDTLLFIARFYSDEKEHLQSIEYFNRLYEIDTENLDVIFELASLYYEVDDYESALLMLDAGLDVDPLDFLFWQLKGDVYHTLNKIPEAIDAYENSLAIEPGSYFAFYGLSNLYFLQKEYKKSLEVNKIYTDEFFDDEYSCYNNGCCYYEMGEYDKAIENFQKSMAYDSTPDPYLTWFGLGKAYYKLKDYDKSCEYFKKTLDINPDLDYVWLYLGYVQLESGRYLHAANSFEKAANCNPENDEACDCYFKITYNFLGIDEAYKVICEIIEKNPNNPKYLLLKTACLIELDRIDEAEQELRTAIAQKPSLDDFFIFYPKIKELENFMHIIEQQIKTQKK